MSKVEMMSAKDQKKGPLVPRLRFPEFRDAGEWKKKEISDLLTIGTGKDYKHLSTGTIPVYGTGGYMLSVDDYLYDGESVCIGRKGTIDNPLFISGKFWTVDTLFYTYKFNNSTPKFIYYCFKKIKWVNYNAASGIPSLSKTTIERIEITVPSLREQQKIAGCLSSLDERITAETSKLDTLKEHKRGLLKQLFPAEGETLPQLRFPEFRDAGEWQKKFLDEYAEVVRGGSPRPIDNFLTKKRDGLNWLKIGDINKEAKYVVATTEKVRAEALSKTREISPGDLILSNSMSFGRPYISKIKTCIHDGWIAIREISKKLHVEYIYYLISTPFSQQYFTSNAAGSGVQNLNADIIKSLPIFFPNILEQQRIADCLSSLDELITAQTQKIDLLKDHKKGLMQQLFPSIDGVRA